MSQTNRERVRSEQAAKAKQARVVRIVGVAAIVTAVAVVGVFIALLFRGTTGTSQLVPPNATTAKDGVLPYPGKANPGAPVVELFFDYQCPGCATLEENYGSKLTELAQAGEIDLRYRGMYFLDANLQNDASLRALVGAACADVAGHYADYHTQVFANQPANEGEGYSDELLRVTIPGKAGLTGDALTSFQACYTQQLTKDFVKAADAANTAMIQSTPTVHVNGKAFEVAMAPDQLGDAIKQAAG